MKLMVDVFHLGMMLLQHMKCSISCLWTSHRILSAISVHLLHCSLSQVPLCMCIFLQSCSLLSYDEALLPLMCLSLLVSCPHRPTSPIIKPTLAVARNLKILSPHLMKMSQKNQHGQRFNLVSLGTVNLEMFVPCLVCNFWNPHLFTPGNICVCTVMCTVD